MFAQLIDGGFSVLEGIFGVWGVCNMVCVVLFVLLWKQMGGHVLMTDWHTTYMDSIFVASTELGIWTCNRCQYHVLKSKFRVGTSKKQSKPPPQFNQLLSLGFLLFWLYARFIGRGCQWLFRKPRPPHYLTSASCGRRRERERGLF